jgi:single-strand DNA-binding protein
MASFNRVILVGNLTRDVQLEKTPQGTPVAEVGLAVKDRVKKGGEWVDEATFVDIILWGRLAEIAAEYLAKGSPALFEGRLKLDTWESKEGQKRSKMRVVAERMQMLGGRSQNSNSGSQGSSNYQAAAVASPAVVEEDSIPDEDIPF